MIECSDITDFDLLLDDLCTDDNTSFEDISSNEDNPATVEVVKCLPLLKVEQQGNTKTMLFDDDGTIIQFQASYPKPRVVYADIRRSYANMFVNCMNSGDFPLMYGFLETFLAPDCRKIATKTFKNTTLVDSRISEQQGVIDISKHWYCRMSIVPDTMVKIKDLRIVSNSKSDETKILARFEMTGTKVLNEFKHQGYCCIHNNDTYNCPTIRCAMQHFATNSSTSKYYSLCKPSINTSSAVTGNKRSRNFMNREKKECMREIMTTVEELVSNLSLREVPIPVQAEGDFIMIIDDQKRISRIELSMVV